MPKISVIVPVYNTEKYLRRCVDSILAQTFTDFELLLIDDGSSDSSGAICDEYAQKDPRVRVFHKENGGVSSARNLGLDNARGEWITFVDSDDWIEIHSLSILGENNDVDLIIASMKFEQSGTCGNFPKIGKLEHEELDHYLSINMDHFSICSPWSKFFRNNIIKENEIRFNNNLCFGEDSLFVKTYLLNVASIRCIDTLCYHYQDVGDDIYIKYSKSFEPIYHYYSELTRIYDRFEKDKKYTISRHNIIGVVYNIAYICLYRNGIKDNKLIKSFLTDKCVYEELKKRKSLNVKMLLLLGKLPMTYLMTCYVKFVEAIKSLINHDKEKYTFRE